MAVKFPQRHIVLNICQMKPFVWQNVISCSRVTEGLWSSGPAGICNGHVSADTTTNRDRGHFETRLPGKSTSVRGKSTLTDVIVAVCYVCN